MISSFRSAIGQMREQARMDRDYQTLMMQEDRILQDIGIARGEVYDAVRNGRRRD
jgi:uncharacterized protein YjiS (DUF1127 family)